MEITKGKIVRAQRMVVYGVEGIGKTTFASMFPSPLFIDIEGGSSHLNVDRTPTPSSWQHLISIVAELAKDDLLGYNTLVLDTMDWAERLAVEDLCNRLGYDGLGGNDDYGKSYSMLVRMEGELLDSLSDIADRGVHVIILAHSTIRRFEMPEEMGAYDRYEMKLERKTAPLIREWPDALLFLNYKTRLTVEKKGARPKASGKDRICYTDHAATHDAKNRLGLPAEIMFDHERKPYETHFASIFGVAKDVGPAPAVSKEASDAAASEQANLKSAKSDLPEHLSGLFDLMCSDEIKTVDLMAGIVAMKHYPEGMNFDDLPAHYVDERLIPNWPKFKEYLTTKGISK